MAKESGARPAVESHEIEGHHVEIRKKEDVEELWIDGVRRRFVATKDGYTLHEDAYARPHKSLLEAVKSFLRKATKKGAW